MMGEPLGLPSIFPHVPRQIRFLLFPPFYFFFSRLAAPFFFLSKLLPWFLESTDLSLFSGAHSVLSESLFSAGLVTFFSCPPPRPISAIRATPLFLTGRVSYSASVHAHLFFLLHGGRLRFFLLDLFA